MAYKNALLTAAFVVAAQILLAQSAVGRSLTSANKFFG